MPTRRKKGKAVPFSPADVANVANIARANPYIQRLIDDAELRGNVQKAYESSTGSEALRTALATCRLDCRSTCGSLATGAWIAIATRTSRPPLGKCSIRPACGYRSRRPAACRVNPKATLRAAQWPQWPALPRPNGAPTQPR